MVRAMIALKFQDITTAMTGKLGAAAVEQGPTVSNEAIRSDPLPEFVDVFVRRKDLEALDESVGDDEAATWWRHSLSARPFTPVQSKSPFRPFASTATNRILSHLHGHQVMPGETHLGIGRYVD
mgnify:FL=1